MPPTRSARSQSTLLLLTALAMAGCGDPGADSDPAADPGAETGEEAAVSEPRDGRARPPTITDTVMLEGMPETMQLSLFRAPEEFPLGFSAYIPADMQPEQTTDGDGASIRFVANFGGQKAEPAFVHMFVFPPGTDLNAAIGSARGYRASRGVPVSHGVEPLGGAGPGARPPWALEAYRFNYEVGDRWYSGIIGVGEHAGRLFQLVMHYPEEMGDGFVPRAELIMGSWRWADGEQLVPRTDGDDGSPEGP